MWPFTSRRIMGSRWWALGFVVFVCWQAIELTGSSVTGDTGNNAVMTDISGAPVDEKQLHDVENTLKAM